MSEPKQPLGWLPPIPVTDERLPCVYCDWSCPRWYQNQTGPKAPPRQYSRGPSALADGGME